MHWELDVLEELDFEAALKMNMEFNLALMSESVSVCVGQNSVMLR